MPIRLLPAVLVSYLAAAVVSVTVVDVSNTGLDTKLEVQTCAGIMNRKESTSDPVYVLGIQHEDKQWLKDLEGIENPKMTALADFLNVCFKNSLVKGYIRYNVTSQAIILPNIITLGGVLDSIPLQDGHPGMKRLSMTFDALSTFAGFAPLDATSYVYDHYVNLTSGMAKMNPGLDVHHHPVNPKLIGTSDPGLVDYIVKERLFNFFLNDGCIPLTKEHALMEKIARNNPWPKPITVYGYDDTYGIQGDLFEAETNCVKEHNMGQVASNGLSNMAFYSRKPSITKPLLQNPEPPREQFNKSRTYIAFVVGDGDNMNFLKGSRRTWMENRVNKCKAGKCSFPLLWTISPHTLYMAPEMAQWYFNQSYVTGNDYFVLPPSGHLYSYPSEMSKTDQASFVTATENDCYLLNTSGTVVWEWFGTWGKAIKEYFPQYAKRGIVRSGFAVNVPFVLPVLEFWDDYYKVLDGNFVLFKPREWRGTSGTSGGVPLGEKFELTAKDMAKEINGYPKGTVTNIYMTSDGGANLEDFYDLVDQLDEHVQVVTHTTIADMAIQASAAKALIAKEILV